MPVPLHRVLFDFGQDHSIEIEWARGRGIPCLTLPNASNLVFAELEAESDAPFASGIPALCWRDDVPPLFEPFQLRENSEYYLDITLPIERSEAERAWEANRVWPFGERLASVFRADPPRRWRISPSGKGVSISGLLRLKSHAGILDLRTPFGTPLLAEVVCRKVEYFSEFQTLLNEVAKELAELLLQYDSPVSLGFHLGDAGSETDAALLFQMRHIMASGNLPVAVDEALAHFHARLIDRTTVEAISAVEEPQIDALIEELDISALGQGGPLQHLFRGYTPREINVTEIYESVDTPENRYVKYFLEECFVLARWLSERLEKKKKPAAAREASAWMTQIDELLGHSQWTKVGSFTQFPSNSQVLQKRRGYREILKFDLSLRLSLELPWKRGGDLADGLLGDVRPVNEIYEYWCFFILRRTLAEICEKQEETNGSFIFESSDKLHIRLEKGKKSQVSFLYKTTPTQKIGVDLFYNQRFKRPASAQTSWDQSYTAFFDPDYSLCLTVTEGRSQQRHWLHFDAKYRLEMHEAEALFAYEPSESDLDLDEGGSEYDREIARLHKRDDLFKMHTYRDGILSSRGAYVLFPGNGAGITLSGKRANLFVRHPSAFGGAPIYKFPSVGAFDLCPGRDDAQRAVLRDFLVEVLNTLLAAPAYQEENGLFGS